MLCHVSLICILHYSHLIGSCKKLQGCFAILEIMHFVSKTLTLDFLSCWQNGTKVSSVRLKTQVNCDAGIITDRPVRGALIYPSSLHCILQTSLSVNQHPVVNYGAIEEHVTPHFILQP